MPTRSHRASTARGDCPWRPSQVAKSTPSSAGSAGSRLLQGERGPADGGTLGEREVRVRGEAAREVQRDGEVVAADPAEPGSAGVADVEDGHVEAVLDGCEPGGVDPVEEPAVGGAAAQVDVLAVVDREVATAEGEGEAAEPGPAFEEGDADSGLGEPERGGDPGEPAADDDGVGLPGLSLGSFVGHAASVRVVAGRDAGAASGVARRAGAYGTIMHAS